MSSDDDDDFDCCCCCNKDSSDRCYVVSVVALIAFCYACYWYLIIIPWQWITKPSLVGLMNVIGLHISFSLLCYSYAKTMWTSPGIVDRGWEPPGTPQILQSLKEMDSTNKNDESLYNFYLPKWCKFCQNWKPPRSHHCQDANACVLKLDHYCPWVYNAVGFRNHKFFILFLFYASLSLTYFLICCVVRITYDISYRQRGRMVFSVTEVVLFILQLVLTLPVTIAIFSLFCYQVSCLISNCTNVETYIYKRYKRVAKKSDLTDFTWFYDHGVYYNICSVMGPSVWSWFIPTLPLHISMGTGVDWKTKQFGTSEKDTLEVVTNPPQILPEKKKNE